MFRDLLSGMSPQFDMRSEADKERAAATQMREVVREQGQVMSAALDNNRSLWDTNKRLRSEREQLIATCQRLESQCNRLQAKLDALPADILERAELQQENDQLKASNAALTHELSAQLLPELDTEQRRDALQRVKAQQAELKATGLVPTEDEKALEDARRDGMVSAYPKPLPNESHTDFLARKKVVEAVQLGKARDAGQ